MEGANSSLQLNGGAGWSVQLRSNLNIDTATFAPAKFLSTGMLIAINATEKEGPLETFWSS
jgi:hypothetical protein